MFFNKFADDLVVVDSSSNNPVLTPIPKEQIIVEFIDDVHNMHDSHDHGHSHYNHSDDAVSENKDVVIMPLGAVPGAPQAEEIEVNESSEDTQDASMVDENDAKKSKKNEKWDWESKGATGFIAWVKDRLENVPRHSGMDTAGLERAISYLEKIDSEISKAMRLDLDGELDADKIEEVRSKIDDGLERLDDRLKKLKKKKKTKKADDENDNLIIKEAQKITGVRGVYVTVPLLVSRIARVCINGMVSGGHDIEDMFSKQAEYYKLNNRERAEVIQLLSDMGYPLKQDRGFLPEDSIEVFDNGMDFASNYRS